MRLAQPVFDRDGMLVAGSGTLLTERLMRLLRHEADGADDVDRHAAEFRRKLKKPGAGVLVQEMVGEGVEVVLAHVARLGDQQVSLSGSQHSLRRVEARGKHGLRLCADRAGNQRRRKNEVHCDARDDSVFHVNLLF